MKPDLHDNLRDLRLTNYELWMCLIDNAGEITGTEADSVMSNYISSTNLPVSKLYKGKNMKPNPVIEHSRFNYDLTPQKIGDMSSPYYEDIFSLCSVCIVEGEFELKVREGMKKIEQIYRILPFGKEYAKVITDLFRYDILPFLNEDSIVLPAKSKLDRPKIISKSALRSQETTRP
jgi:hypothetical protein